MKKHSKTPIFWTMIVVTLFALALSFQGCYYDKADLVYPSSCDTTNVKYSASIVPILSANCYRCHGGSDVNVNDNGRGIRLDTYPGASTQAKNGKLSGSIQHLSGYTQMPLGSSKLVDCNINAVLIWVRAGAPNN